MKKYLYIIVGLAFLAGIVWLIKTPGKPSKYDQFAQCLGEKKAVFYGAFWCKHCQAQKALFGKAVKYLPYVECSTPDGQGQNGICNDKGITTYPTWDFASTTSTTTDRVLGVVELEDLAEKTSCVLPE